MRILHATLDRLFLFEQALELRISRLHEWCYFFNNFWSS
jgi:hypothetical protein